MSEIIRDVFILCLIASSGIGGFFAGTWHGQAQIYSQLLNNMEQAVGAAGVRKP